MPLGVMGAQLKASLEPLGTVVQSGPLVWSSMMPKYACTQRNIVLCLKVEKNTDRIKFKICQALGLTIL